MPRHYAKDVNVLSGRVSFQNSKFAIAFFRNEAGEQVSFSKRPFVEFTVADDTSKPATRLSWEKSGSLYIGCRIKFASNFTGDVDWGVRE